MDPIEHMGSVIGWIWAHPMWVVLMAVIELAWLGGVLLFTRRGPA